MENILNWFSSFSVSDAITIAIALIGAVISIIKSISAKKSAVKAEEQAQNMSNFYVAATEYIDLLLSQRSCTDFKQKKIELKQQIYYELSKCVICSARDIMNEVKCSEEDVISSLNELMADGKPISPSTLSDDPQSIDCVWQIKRR
jgi:hypothetical protein